MNASRASKESGEPLRLRIGFDELGAARPRGEVVVYDWRAGTFARAPADGAIEETLAYQTWSYRVLCPLLPGGVALFGDVSKFATMGDRRIAGVELREGALRCEVLGAPGEHVVLSGCARARAARRALDARRKAPRRSRRTSRRGRARSACACRSARSASRR